MLDLSNEGTVPLSILALILHLDGSTDFVDLHKVKMGPAFQELVNQLTLSCESKVYMCSGRTLLLTPHECIVHSKHGGPMKTERHLIAKMAQSFVNINIYPNELGEVWSLPV